MSPGRRANSLMSIFANRSFHWSFFLVISLACAQAAWSQDEREIPAEPGDEIEAKGKDGGRAQVPVDRDICGILEEEGTTRTRNSYQPWIKELICDYLEADFTNNEARKSFVEKTLAEYRHHPEGEGWKILESESVVHVVTRNPAFIDDTQKAPKVRRISVAQMSRSLKHPNKAAIGLHQSFFHTPAPTTWDEAWQVVPKAETALLLIFGLKYFADTAAEAEAGMSAEKVTRDTRKQVAAFRQELLSKAREPRVASKEGIPPRLRIREDNAPGLALDAARNQTELVSQGPDAIRIDQVPRGKPLGKTNHATGMTMRFSRSPSSQMGREDLESIEEFDLFKERWIVEMALRAVIAIQINVPSFRVRSGIHPLVFTRDERTDCTPIILAHETIHGNDTWGAWKTLVLDRVMVDLENLAFASLKKEQSRDVLRLEGWGNRAAVDFRVTYAFRKVDKKVAQAALKQLKTRFNSRYRAGLKKEFQAEVDRLEEELHAREEGLDDDCQSVPSGARRAFGDSKAKSLKLPAPEVR